MWMIVLADVDWRPLVKDGRVLSSGQLSFAVMRRKLMLQNDTFYRFFQIGKLWVDHLQHSAQYTISPSPLTAHSIALVNYQKLSKWSNTDDLSSPLRFGKGITLTNNPSPAPLHTCVTGCEPLQRHPTQWRHHGTGSFRISKHQGGHSRKVTCIHYIAIC